MLCKIPWQILNTTRTKRTSTEKEFRDSPKRMVLRRTVVKMGGTHLGYTDQEWVCAQTREHYSQHQEVCQHQKQGCREGPWGNRLGQQKCEPQEFMCIHTLPQLCLQRTPEAKALWQHPMMYVRCGQTSWVRVEEKPTIWLLSLSKTHGHLTYVQAN